MHFKHHNGSLRDFNAFEDVEYCLLIDWMSNVRRGISLSKTQILISTH